MKSNPLVSIIMAAYNAEDTIYDAIYSVFSQEYKDFELLIVNDGSTDRTEEIALSFVDPRIKYLRQKNQGVSSARNLALSVMRGEYFCILDSDDKFTNRSLSSRIRHFQEHEDVDFVDGMIEIWDNGFQNVIETRIQEPNDQPFRALCSIDDSVFFGPTWMIRRRDDFDYSFDLNLTHGEDLLFFITISEFGGKYDAIRDVVYQYRSGNDSAMSNLDGLWSGYQYIYHCLKSSFELKAAELSFFKKKITSIMFKSFISRGRLLEALRVLLHYRKL